VKLEVMQCDVVIVGLGPTGAMLANLLGAYGWSVVTLERDADIYYAPRAVHFDDEVMRIFQAAGLSDAITRTSEAFRDMEITLKPGGRPVLRTEIGTQDGRYGHPGAWWFHQPTLERQLREGLERFDRVQVLNGMSVTHIEQHPGGGVTATACDQAGQSWKVRGRYLIGCDGGRSVVRKEMGLTLDSADFDEAWVVVDTRTRSGKKEAGLPPRHQQVCDPSQPVTYVPMAGPYYEWQFMVVGNKTEREATDPYLVRQQLKQFVDLDRIEINRIAYYRFHALWAREWRKGHVLLAGDAAHQMPPFLGQGMCAGVRDAHSLAWRLDLVLRGQAGVATLDDYVHERSAHVRQIINGAMFLGRLIQTRNPLIAFLRNNLLFRPASWFPRVSSLFQATANRKRPLQSGCFGSRRRQLAGHLAIQPMLTLAAGHRVPMDDLARNSFMLLARKGKLDSHIVTVQRLKKHVPIHVVEFAAQAREGIVGDHECKLAAWFDQHDVDVMLIRPDRYIYDGCRGDGLPSLAGEFVQRIQGASNPQHTLAEAA